MTEDLLQRHHELLKSAPDVWAKESTERRWGVGDKMRSESLQIISEGVLARAVMTKDEAGEYKKGIVLGSGSKENTEKWKKKHWKTLDIDDNSGADIIHDANTLDKVVAPASQDFLYAEFIRFDPLAKEGVGHNVLLEQANKALKPGGMLIIGTANVEGVIEGVDLPPRKPYSQQLKEYGFRAVIVVEPYIFDPTDPTIKEQEVTYYGKKIAELPTKN